jgi:dienelactone hydrolase
MKNVTIGELLEELTLRDCLTVWAGKEPGSLEEEVMAGTCSPPEEGEVLPAADGSQQTWKAVAAGEDGWFRSEDLEGGWDSAGGFAYLCVEASSAAVVLLHAQGHRTTYVNGEPRAGDERLPVLLRQGANHLLFHCDSMGELKVTLAPAKSHALLNTGDTTLPDLIIGEETRTWGAVVVINPSESPLHGVTIRAICPGGLPVETPVPVIPPLGLRKVGLRIEGPAPAAPGPCALAVELVGERGGAGRVLDRAAFELQVRTANEIHQRTFVSRIDGSVQCYAVNPPPAQAEDEPPPALVLTLHGAGFPPIKMVSSYASKPLAYIVAPTGRRTLGFEWERWGCLDVMEVLEVAQRELGTDPRRTYLTGHSMGGHGAWHVAEIFPDRFAAVGPGAGWLTRWTYRGASRPEGDTPLARLLERGRNSEDTLALAPNLACLGVYISHGEADDDVPVGQSRAMKERLDAFHPDVTYYEHPGAGHWWTNSAPPVMDAADWPPLFVFLRDRQMPAREELRRVEFTTAEPGLSAWCYWAGIEAQLRPADYSSISLTLDPARRRFAGTTANVARLALDLDHLPPGEPVEVTLDGQELASLPWPEGMPRLWLTCREGRWSTSPAPAPFLKGPHRNGPFWHAFRNRPVLVYGTAGTVEENAWALAKARYDAEVFWEIGNGSLDVVADAELDPAAEPKRNVIVYGHAESTRVWMSLLAESPVQVRPGLLRLGDRELRGNDLACLFVRPRPRSDTALVGVIAGTGVAGMRLACRPQYLSCGNRPCPDWLVIAPEGDCAAGYFGTDWGVESGECIWERE